MTQLNSIIISEAVSRACQKLPAAFAYLHGSRMTGHTHEGSDIDIAIGFTDKAPAGYQRCLDAIAAINHELSVPIELLDIKDFDELPLALRFRVLRDGQLVYCSDIARQRDRAFRTLSFYHDQKPMIDRYANLFFKLAAQK